MRKCLILITLLALVAGLVGCSASTGGSGGEAKSSDSSGSSSSKGSKGASADDPYPGLELETDGEKDALAIAESEEGRKWASGDYQNGSPVEGDAALVGYTFIIHDGATYYQARVMGGKLVSYIGMGSTTFISGPYDPAGWRSATPETDRQREAWELALAELAKTNPNATQGGIESYVFLFPENENGNPPSVLVYSNRTDYSSFAMGGAWYE